MLSGYRRLITYYAGLTVRGTGPDITAIRLSELATLLTNRQIALNNIFMLGSSRGLGHRPFTARTGIRIPYRVPKSFWGHSLFKISYVSDPKQYPPTGLRYSDIV